jgi:E3 ubiquitin-protein ligase UBR1
LPLLSLSLSLCNRIYLLTFLALFTTRCGGQVGIFLIIRKCVILYLHELSGSFMVAPYLNKFGETDPSLRNNMRLYLNQKRYDSIVRQAWLSHTIPSVVARKLEGETNTGGWESL